VRLFSWNFVDITPLLDISQVTQIENAEIPSPLAKLPQSSPLKKHEKQFAKDNL